MGLFFKKTKPDEDLEKKGIRGHATVLHVQMSGMGMEMSMSGGKAKAMLEGDVTPIKRKVRLRVEVPGREAYEVETKIPVPVMMSGRVAAGAGLTVLVDPNDPKNLAVDWSAGVEQGSTSAMFADNPMAQAALRGAGYDPAQLGAQIDAARAQAAQAMAAWQTQQGQAGVVPGQMPPGMMPSGMPQIPLPPGWQMPAGFPHVPGAVPAANPQVPGATPGVPGTPEAVTPGGTPAGWPQPQPWPESTDNPVGPTSEDQPKE